MFFRKIKSLNCLLKSELRVSILILQYDNVDFSTETFNWLDLSLHKY